MTLLLAALVLITVASSKYNFAGYHNDYISKDGIEPIKGIFLVFVLLSHFAQYVTLDGARHHVYMVIRQFHGQLIVAPFLFYSGYGVTESIKLKGESYVKKIPFGRCFKVLINFDLAVLMYYLLALAQNKSYPAKKVLLALTGWESLGNSNWYIFTVTGMYFITFLSFYSFDWRKQKKYVITMLILFTRFFSYFMSLYKVWAWYSTIWCYVAGVVYALYKVEIETNILYSNKSFYISFLCLTLAFISFYINWRKNVLLYQITSVCFALLVVFISVKIKVKSRLLYYCGKHLFSLYILQRLPMIVLQNTAMAHNIYLYFFICVAVTVLLSARFDKFTDIMWKKIDSITVKGH